MVFCNTSFYDMGFKLQPLALQVGETASFNLPGLHSDPNGIVKSCDLSSVWLTVEILSTIKSKNFSEIGSDL